jgi:hypothetical protein
MSRTKQFGAFFYDREKLKIKIKFVLAMLYRNTLIKLQLSLLFYQLARLGWATGCSALSLHEKYKI